MLERKSIISLFTCVLLLFFAVKVNSLSIYELFGISKESKEKKEEEQANQNGTNDNKNSSPEKNQTSQDKDSTNNKLESNSQNTSPNSQKNAKKPSKNPQDAHNNHSKEIDPKSIANDLEKINLNTFQGSSKAHADKQNAVINLLNAAKTTINKLGKTKAFKEFSRKNNIFTQGEAYIFAVDYNGTVLASNDSTFIGKNMNQMQALEGASVFKLALQTAKAGGGWVNYRWKNPVSGQIECKRSYIMPMEGYYIGSGYYFTSFQGGRCE